ncbi:MAG: hydrogenase 3 maturation endopeptidase HyCI [Candidatus Omnitrophica bacterium]|nr:hydrogenase 3 maturation endopeptidase HyCI [Candidatus Omnitrophota bacterium]
MLKTLLERLKGKVVILGMGNTLRSDDGAGSVLANRLKDKLAFTVWDVGVAAENYLEKIIQYKPDTVIIIDAADFGGRAGEFRILEADDLKTINFFSTHNASISLLINYLQSNLNLDIMLLIIQPKSIVLGDKLSPEVDKTLTILEDWSYAHG